MFFLSNAKLGRKKSQLGVRSLSLANTGISGSFNLLKYHCYLLMRRWFCQSATPVRILNSMPQPYAVCFAGVPGSSKSIVAHHLSCEFGLPIFSTDNIRFEVKEDMRVPDINIPTALAEYDTRVAERRRYFLSKNSPIILDGSVDRRWNGIRQELLEARYDWFVINMELSHDFLIDLFTATSRYHTIGELDVYLKQHHEFIREFKDVVQVTITDATFPDRLTVAAEALRQWLSGRE